MKLATLIAAALGASCLFAKTGQAAVTAGWENVAPDRHEAEVEESKLVWRADMGKVGGFRLVKRNGAEGTMAFRDGELHLVKSNALGELVVEAPPFFLPSNVTVQVSAEVNVESATPGRSHGCLLITPKSGVFGVQLETRGMNHGNGRNILYGLYEQPAGTYYRQYCHYAGNDTDVQPVIILSGDPSVSTWRNWRAENRKDSLEVYRRLQQETVERRNAAGYKVATAEEVARQCAESADHTAKMVMENGVAYLTVDGKKTPPAAYHGVYHHADHSEQTSGQPMTSRGVPLTVAWVYGANPNWKGNSTWPTGTAYDAKKAADNFRDLMRGDTNALYVVAFECNAPKDFVSKCFPDEGWIGEDGKPIVGGPMFSLWNPSDDYDRERYWPWVSMASPAWRRTVNAFLRDFVAELKRTGHAKKVVGVHFMGYEDGQFNMYKPDYSPCAQAEYKKYLKEIEGTGLSTNYWQFCRQLAVLAQTEFAKTFKQAMGKDVVAIRWDSSPFMTDFAHGTMARDPDGIDICVTQPTYSDRYPAIATSPYAPWSSLLRHNKMHWYEMDLRTWWSMVSSSLPADTGLGYSVDIVHWRTTYRKLAGQMLAQRSGFWFFDMGRGWQADAEIAEDIGESVKTMRELSEKAPSPWTSDVAVVADEEGLLGFEGARGFKWSNATYNMCERQLDYMAGAGVPYDFYLAEDVIANPMLLKGKKTVIFMLWRHFDARRIAALKALAGLGQTHVFLSESGCLGGAKEATGFAVEYCTRNRPLALKPEPHFKESVVGSYEAEKNRGNWLPRGVSDEPFYKADGRQVWIKEEPGVIVHARYAWDTNHVAIAERRDKDARRWYLAVPGGLTPEIFQRIVREAGAYMPVDRPGLMVNMNGDFISIHALKGGHYDFKLPFACEVVNVKSGKPEPTKDGVLPLDLTPGETCWFLLK